MKNQQGHDWQRAASFAARAHQGQLRKDGKTPYFAHPVRVALTVLQVFGIDDRVVLCAALLHDTIEDTTTDYDDLIDAFGAEVADAVAALTKDSRLVEADRERACDERLKDASWQARLVKLADVYDNFCDTAEGPQRTKAAEKARRAIACAGTDSRFKSAIAALEELLHRGPA